MKHIQSLLLAVVLVIAVEPSASGVWPFSSDDLRRDPFAETLIPELSTLPAPENPLPRRPTSLQERPAPSGVRLPANELGWRALYDADPERRRVASRVVRPKYRVGDLESLLIRLENARVGSEVPAVGILHEPRAIPALRRALARASDDQMRWFVLRALYDCGDWNHSAELVKLAKSKNYDHHGLRMLGVYHPQIGTQACLEALGFAERVELGIPKQASTPQVEAAWSTLRRLQYPQVKEVLLRYFEGWPAPQVARHLADLGVTEAIPLIKKAALAAPTNPHTHYFASQSSYHYALAKLGDQDSMAWMLEKARLIASAPPMSSEAARRQWNKETGIENTETGPFGRLLVKLGTPETLGACAEMVSAENPMHRSSLGTWVFGYTRSPAAVDALEIYFQRHGAQEKKRDASEAKKALALHPDNPKAMRLLEEYMPDKTQREDLIAIGREFGWQGLMGGGGATDSSDF